VIFVTDPRHYTLDPDLAPDPDISITKNHNKKNLDSYYSVISLFIFFDPKTDPDPNLNPNSDIYFWIIDPDSDFLKQKREITEQ
jgi:hypothetical protein